MAPRLTELSRIPKLYFALALIVCGLVFYAIGIVTNFFASPMFSMFFILSRQTAYNVAYVVITIASALTILEVTLSIVKKRKEQVPETNNKPTVPTIKPPTKAPIRTTQQTNSAKIIINLPKNYTKEQENQSVKQQIMQPTKQSTTQAYVQADIDENEPTNQQYGPKQNTNKIICQACKKEFSTPLLMVDYSNAKPRLVSHCPYCDQPLEDNQKKIAEEEHWNKYFKQP